jgi:hypothetical protein
MDAPGWDASYASDGFMRMHGERERETDTPPIGHEEMEDRGPYGIWVLQ